MRKEGWDARWADRRNAREENNFPLLALSGDLKKYTAEQCRASVEERFAGLARLEVKHGRMAVLFRASVARRIDPAALANLDRRRAFLPTSNAYSASFWRTELAALLGRSCASKGLYRKSKVVW